MKNVRLFVVLLMAVTMNGCTTSKYVETDPHCNDYTVYNGTKLYIHRPSQSAIIRQKVKTTKAYTLSNKCVKCQ
jgi:hypothetical protein